MSVNVTVLLYVDIVPECSLMLLYYCMLVVSFASGCLVSDSSASQQSRIAAPYNDSHSVPFAGGVAESSSTIASFR